MELRKAYVNTLVPTPCRKRSVVKRVRWAISQPLHQFLLLLIGIYVLYALNRFDPKLMPPSIINALGATFIYAIAALGFCLLLGYSGLASLATGGFIGIGAYSAFYTMQQNNHSYLFALLVTFLISLAIGVLVGFISLRIEGIYLAILTLGLSEIIRNLLMALQSSINLSMKKIKLFGNVINDKQVFMLVGVVLVVILILTANLIHSPTGRAMLAIKNSTSAAQAMGISLLKLRLTAFIISTVYAAIAGLMYMMLITNITTTSSQLLTLATSLNILGAVIIGGSRSLWGTLVGVYIIYGLNSTVLNRIPFFVQNEYLITLITGVLLILIVMFYPGGLAQMVRNTILWLKKIYYKLRRRRYGQED